MRDGSGRGSCLVRSHDLTGGTMGRIFRHRAGRRMFVGVLSLAGLALVACEPLKQPPAPPPPAELPQICIPNNTPRAEAEPAPAEPDCTPICLPGQEPPADPTANLIDPGPAPEPACVPICQPSTGGGDPQASPALAARQRCIRIPVPCVPGVDIPDCVNFCPPGQDPQPQPAAELKGPDCTPLCTLLPPGTPGSCSRVPDPAR